ncbi:MAG: hypothetical protein MUF76_14580, partial [Hydrogenophaga sp.]|nr:hypothetical protein [Hydrogenophaga sp.]
MNARWNVSQWSRRQWAVAIVLVVLVTLTPLAWVQWQQVRMLQDVSRKQVDSIMWQAYQLEYELFRLDDALHAATDPTTEGQTPVDAFELQERYEVFYSRIQLLTGMPRRDLLESSTAFTEALQGIR